MVAAALAGLALSSVARAADAADTVVHKADVTVTFQSALACEVSVALEVLAPPDTILDHRLLAAAATRVTAVTVEGAGVRAADPQEVGRTLSLRVAMDSAETHAYRVRYRAEVPDAMRARCPVWLPAAATTGERRAVQIRVSLPHGARPLADVFPPFTWTGPGEGVASLADLPSVVRVPFSADDRPAGPLEGVGVRGLVDAAALLILAAAAVVWARSQGRR